MITMLFIILAAVMGMTLIALVNVLFFPSLCRGSLHGTRPRVSVLLPARNEERNLEESLETLRAQQYEPLDITVLDDNSSDRTADVARRIAETDTRLTVVSGEALPAGWVGKSHACHQLSQRAHGDLLLFVDADTHHAPGTIEAAVAELSRTSADLLTVIPHQRMVGCWEKVVLPMLHFSTFCYLPMPLVSRTRSPKLAMANGQFMLWRRGMYDTVGGHRSVRNAMVEDVWLSRRVKQAGGNLVVRDGGDLVSTRMYTSLREIWAGFSKNLFAGFQYSVPMIAGVILFNLATSVVPFALVGAALATGRAGELWSQFSCASAALILLIRLLLALRFRLDLWPIILHPVAALLLVGIAINSSRWVLFGGGARWKGRIYDHRNHAVPEQ